MNAHTNDGTAIRALAHPLRLQLLDLLRYDGPSTATRLAARVGESSGATSYHLRQLARFGYVEDAPGGQGRERRWRYREQPVVLATGAADPAGRQLVAGLLARETHALDRFLAEGAETPEWDSASFFRSKALRLTPDELNRLRQELEKLLAPFRAAEEEDAPENARPVRLLTFGYPLPLEKP